MIMKAREAPSVSIIVARFFEDPDEEVKQVSKFVTCIKVRSGVAGKHTSTIYHRFYGRSLVRPRY